MKNLFLIVFFVACGLDMQAQEAFSGSEKNWTSSEVSQSDERLDYRPMICEGRSWYYYAQDIVSGKDFYFYLTIVGDTVVEDRECKKILYNSTDTTYFYGAAYEKDEQVLIGVSYIGSTDIHWYRLYDFQVDVGESAFGTGPRLKETDTVSVNGTEFRRLYLVEEEDAFKREYIWVEGIGSQWGLVNPTGIMATGYVVERFLRCYQDDECIFTAEDFNKSAITSVESIAVNRLPYESVDAVYDLQGLRLSSLQGGRLPKGIYIKNGKKFVIK